MFMEKNQFKIVIAGMIIIFIMTCMNMCHSCSSSRKADEVKAMQARIDSMNVIGRIEQTKQFELQLQMLQPQVVNQFLSIFNSEKYNNEIDLNNVKIKALQDQLKNINDKNDATKTH